MGKRNRQSVFAWLCGGLAQLLPWCCAVGVVVLLAGFVAVGAAMAKEPLRLGVFPYKSPKVMMRLFLPVAKELEKTLGQPVRLATAGSPKQFNQRAAAGQYDLIWPCNTCYLRINEMADFQAIAQGVPSFQGGIIVRKDSGITSMEQLKGGKVAAVGKGSYAGFKFFQIDMAKQGIKVPGDVHVSHLGKLDSIIYAVVNRSADAGVIRTDALASHRFDPVRDDLTVIAHSAKIPQFPFAVRGDLDPVMVKKIVQVLTAIDGDSPQEQAILKALKIKAVQPCTDADYDQFRQLAKGFRW